MLGTWLTMDLLVPGGRGFKDLNGCIKGSNAWKTKFHCVLLTMKTQAPIAAEEVSELQVGRCWKYSITQLQYLSSVLVFYYRLSYLSKTAQHYLYSFPRITLLVPVEDRTWARWPFDRTQPSCSSSSMQKEPGSCQWVIKRGQCFAVTLD